MVHFCVCSLPLNIELLGSRRHWQPWHLQALKSFKILGTEIGSLGNEPKSLSVQKQCSRHIYIYFPMRVSVRTLQLCLHPRRWQKPFLKVSSWSSPSPSCIVLLSLPPNGYRSSLPLPMKDKKKKKKWWYFLMVYWDTLGLLCEWVDDWMCQALWGP